MTVTVESVAEEALALPVSGRAVLVEKLLESLAGEIDPLVEHSHLAEIQKRRAAVDSGQAKLIDGSTGLREARVAIHS